MGGTQGGLASAVSRADSQLTVLADRIDAEEHAEWLWLKAHVLRGYLHHRVVIGTEVLPFPWRDRTYKFINARSAEVYLHNFYGNSTAMHSLRSLAASVSTGSMRALSKEELVAVLGAALVTGRAWVIELPNAGPKSRFVGKTDPAAFAPINPSLGTNVDFAYIASLEGDQWLRGYVPFKKGGIVAGRSGMTIASGFDVGQWKKTEILGMNLPKEVLAQILPYADMNFKTKTKAQVAAQVGKIGPVPEFKDKKYADLCDAAVFTVWLGRAFTDWNRKRQPGVPIFAELPGGWQTVWLSRHYQAQSGPFETLALAGKWKPAITALGAEPLYRSRTASEANLLEVELPPVVIAPSPKR